MLRRSRRLDPSHRRTSLCKARTAVNGPLFPFAVVLIAAILHATSAAVGTSARWHPTPSATATGPSPTSTHRSRGLLAWRIFPLRGQEEATASTTARLPRPLLAFLPAHAPTSSVGVCGSQRRQVQLRHRRRAWQPATALFACRASPGRAASSRHSSALMGSGSSRSLQASALTPYGGNSDGNGSTPTGYGAADTSVQGVRDDVEEGDRNGEPGQPATPTGKEADGLLDKRDERFGGRGGLTRQILELTLPALVSLCVDPLMSAVDTAYVGRLGPDLGGGEVGLGALGLNTYIFTFAFYVFVFLATVPTPFVASARAKGDEAGAAKLVGQLLSLALALGLVLVVVLEAFGPSVLNVMGATAVNETEALAFLRARALSAPAVLVMTVGNGAFRGFLDTRTPLLIALGANAVNFVLDPILIFKLGLGVQGAAIATVAAEWTGALAFLRLLMLKEPRITPQLLSLPQSSDGWEQGRAVATSSAAVFGRTVALQAALTTASAFAARAGPTSIAAHQVASQLWILLAFAADSLAVAAQGLIADRMGAGKLPAARDVAAQTLVMSAVWGMGLLVVFQVAGGVLPLIFTSDTQVLEALVPVIAVIGWMQPINAYVFVGDGVLQGSQDFVYEAITMALSASVGAGFIVLRPYTGSDITLLDVWIGLVLMQGSRALTFSFRHWLDPRGPLASRADTNED